MKRPLAAIAAGVVLPMLLTACGGDDEVGERTALPTETPALWNPCDALTVKFIKQQFGADTEKNSGTPTEPDCRFAPEEDSGEPVVTANYQLFDGTLDQLWDAMGQQDDADVRDPKIKGADAARIVVDAKKKQLYVTGFVQNGTLFEVVNVADPRPYDEDAIVAAVEATLEKLSDHAVETGAGTPASAAADGS